MPNLDLDILKIMNGDTEVLKVMQGDTKVWPSGDIAIIDCALTNITSDISLPTRVALHSSLVITLTPNTSHVITVANVVMGGTDITSTVYSNGVITVADVTGDIVITASAIEVITFADATVKQICVDNWGGGVVEGEITPAEAAAVTALEAKFYNNTEITSFDEFRYFTGGVNLWYENTGSSVAGYRGQFAGCSALKSITIPDNARASCIGGVFYGCTALEVADLSKVTLTASGTWNRRNAMGFYNCQSLKTIILPFDNQFSQWYNWLYHCYDLETLEANNWGFGLITSTTGNFSHCTKLANLPHGLPGWKITMSFSACPLTHESAVNLLNSLGTVSGKTITFKATTYETLSAEEIAIGTNKGWSIVSA